MTVVWGGHRSGFALSPERSRSLGRRRGPAARHDVALEYPSRDCVRDDSEGTSMMTHTAAVTDVEADIRWRDWQARGVASDRRTAARMLKLLLLIVAGFVAWFVVRLT